MRQALSWLEKAEPESLKKFKLVLSLIDWLVLVERKDSKKENKK